MPLILGTSSAWSLAGFCVPATLGTTIVQKIRFNDVLHLPDAVLADKAVLTICFDC
jgi:hypothetical protein